MKATQSAIIAMNIAVLAACSDTETTATEKAPKKQTPIDLTSEAPIDPTPETSTMLPDSRPSPGRSRSSEFRAGVTVQFIYHQPLEGVYSTNWWGRLEKHDGDWRDVYFETDDKYVNNGFLSFNCVRNATNIGIIMYHGREFGAAERKNVIIVQPNQRSSWANGNFEPLQGEDPPFTLYLRAKERFC